ncbi:MAG: carbohydrate ABC transporter permease [Armatimonadetes bacterium]|nr:carbohydrate ABC transporter permease [Armatimonadota bacterium]
MQVKTPWLRPLVHLVLIAGSLVCLFPLLWMISTSLKPITETMTLPPRWIPSVWQWVNYPRAVMYQSDKLGYIPFLVYAQNTLYLAVLGVTGCVLSNAVVAYGFSRIRWRGRETLFAITLATMMIPFPVTMVPMYVLYRHLHWIGTFKPLWVGAWCGGAFNIFLLRQFFMTIPQELSEAARVDGCSEWRIFWRIILPLAKPALAVVALFHFMYVWNDFLGPLIYLQDQRQFTLALGLQAYQSQHGGTEWNMLMAAATIMVLPIIVLFFFAQKTFIQGISVTGLKG